MIIAEIGINHNGDLDLAKRMILEAKNSGADCVKFQKRTPEVCVPEQQKNIMKDTPWGRMTYLDYKKKIEFGYDDYVEIDLFCTKIGIKWSASVWDTESLMLLKDFDIPFVKIPSAMMANKGLVSATFATFKKVVVSTGMSTQEEIDELIKSIPEDNEVVLMHCTSTYPTKPQHENLAYIRKLQRHFIHKGEVGYSGHELGFDATLVARVLGCKWIERHFTLNNDMWGTDQKSSLNPEDFKLMTKGLKKVDLMMGSTMKLISDEEIAIRTKLRP